MDDKLFEELASGIEEMKAVERGEASPARVTSITRTEVTRIRQSMNLSQPQFARMMGISVRTLQNWEQGHRKPTGPAKVLLSLMQARPYPSSQGSDSRVLRAAACMRSEPMPPRTKR